MPRAFASRDQFDDGMSGPVAMILSLVLRRPLDSLAGALAAACVVMILVNALLLQQPRTHARANQAAQAPAAEPAQPQRRAAEAPKRSELVEQVQTALAERDLYDGVVDGLPGSATAAAIRAFEQSQGMAPTGESSDRLLAALLTAPIKPAEPARPAPRVAAAKPAPAASAAPTATGSTNAANPNLMAAQRALAKIGYGPVSIDGKMGAETRNAIKSFERDRGLPETGELNPAMLRALQAMTGTPLQ